MPLKTTLLGAAAAVGLMIGAATSAQASIILDLLNVTAGSPAGNFSYNYRATLAADESLQTGSFFTLYDFGPVVGANPLNPTGAIVNFSFAQAFTNVPAQATIPNDSPTILNDRATYTGTPLNGTALNNGAAGNLGTFSLTSANGASVVRQNIQDSQALKFGGPSSGIVDSYIGPLAVPTFAAVPEPMSLAVLGTTLVGLGMLRRRKKN